MVATFLRQELSDELKKIFKGFRLKNPQGEESELNIFEQLLPMPEPAGIFSIRKMQVATGPVIMEARVGGIQMRGFFTILPI